MVNEKTYYDTQYSFINPVRHFKANDPYYYEVDNIPIKQLEENTNFLKDQVDGLLTREEDNQEIEIGRSGFSELKPFATGQDRIVYVKPGRYTARINNAYDITPLQVIEQIEGFNNTTASADINTWQVETNRGNYVSGILEEFNKSLTGIPLNMNGLSERTFVFPIDDEDGTSNNGLLDVTSIDNYTDLDSSLAPDDRPLWPNVIGAILKHTTADTTRDLSLLKGIFTAAGSVGNQQGRIESEFIKRWRGAIRTAVVDVPSQLSIQIPEFDEDDFYIINENGNVESIGANQRIDLLFIYSKAVDEESTTISKFTGGSPDVLPSATLGILKGAGLGVSRQLAPDNTNPSDKVDLTLNGVPIMLAHPGDEGGNNGFTTSAGTIKGSFPSPDDLLNLAPVLSENLETTAWPLIGQTILPIAYILVEKPSVGVAEVIRTSDIMDIRPFFRTTELAYNERAGIAAATPQISIANPVVSEAHLEKVRSEIYTDLFTRINNVQGGGGGSTSGGGPPPSQSTNIIAAGMVLGGFNYGPEGALARQRNALGNSPADLKNAVELEFGFAQNRIPLGPEWDRARWYNIAGFNDDQPLDSINIADSQLSRHGNDLARQLPPYNGIDPGAFSLGVQNFNGNMGSMGFAKGFRNQHARATPGGTYGNGDQQVYNTAKMNAMYFVSKKIFLNNNPYDDYHVNVNYLNCIPVTTGFGQAKSNFDYSHGIAQPAGIFVIKNAKYFIINVAFNSDALFPDYRPIGVVGANSEHQKGNIGKPWLDRTNARHFSAFMLPDFNCENGTDETFQTWDSKLQDEPINNFPLTLNPNAADVTQNMLDKLREQETATGSPTLIQYFNAITPILYPSVTFEVIGIDGSLAANIDLSDRSGNSVIDLPAPSTSP